MMSGFWFGFGFFLGAACGISVFAIVAAFVRVLFFIVGETLKRKGGSP